MAQPKLSPFGMAFAGAVGGVISNAVVYPLDTVKTRIQAETDSSSSKPVPPSPVLKRPGAPRDLGLASQRSVTARQVLMAIVKEQGIAGLYRGFAASMLNTFSMQFAYFYWYTIVRRTYVNRLKIPTQALGTLTELVLGAVAGAFAQVFTIPVSVIATRQQLADTPAAFFTTLSSILNENGLTGLWRGLRPSLILTVNPAITYGMFARLKTSLLGEHAKMTPGKAFVLGAASKTLATVVTYPYIMAKVRLQAKYSGGDGTEADASSSAAGSTSKTSAVVRQKKKKKERYSGAVDVLQQVYREKGFVGWYQGMQAQITKAVLSQALLFGIKDALEAYVVLALVWYSRYRGTAVGLKP